MSVGPSLSRPVLGVFVLVWRKGSGEGREWKIKNESLRGSALRLYAKSIMGSPLNSLLRESDAGYGMRTHLVRSQKGRHD